MTVRFLLEFQDFFRRVGHQLCHWLWIIGRMDKLMDNYCEISLLSSHFGLMSDFGLGLVLFQPNPNWFVLILFSSRFIPLSVLVGFVIEHSVIEFCTLWFGISDERFFTSIVICYGFCTSHACFSRRKWHQQSLPFFKYVFQEAV